MDENIKNVDKIKSEEGKREELICGKIYNAGQETKAVVFKHNDLFYQKCCLSRFG